MFKMATQLYPFYFFYIRAYEILGKICGTEFNVLLTVHHAMILGNCPT